MAISITLDSIECSGTSESNGDEIYVVYQADAGVPRHILPPGKHHTMNAGDVWTIGQKMTFSRDLLVTIYEQDPSHAPSVAEYLVSYDYTPIDIPLTTRRTNPNGASYTFNVTRNG